MSGNRINVVFSAQGELIGGIAEAREAIESLSPTIRGSDWRLDGHCRGDRRCLNSMQKVAVTTGLISPAWPAEIRRAQIAILGLEGNQ